MDNSDSASDLVDQTARKILKGRTSKNVMRLSELLSVMEKEIGAQIQGSAMYHVLKKVAARSDSPVSSRLGRNGGYYLSELDASEVEQDLSKLTTSEERKREKHLYPLVTRWLKRVKGLSGVKDISGLKKGGTWSNPDIVGIDIVEDLGFFDVEITTIEVKPNLGNWRYFFFEAVSHKRFAERAYFVFWSNGTLNEDEKSQLLRYAEKYNVGLAFIDISEEEYGQLLKWEKMSENDRTELAEQIVEWLPAPIEPIPLREKIDFLRRLGVESKQSIYQFGDPV